MLLRLRDAGDDAAWSQFVAIYTPLIFGFCRRRGLSEPDARDVLQEVLRAVAVAISRFEYDPRRSSFRNWLFTVVRSKLNNFLTANARQPRPAGESTLQDFVDNAAVSTLEEAWQREYQANLLRWASEQIKQEFKPQTWDAFWRTAINGEAAEDVARESGLTLNAIYVGRSRVTQRLREIIEGLGDPLKTGQEFADA